MSTAATTETFVVEGYLFTGPEGATRILIGDLYLDILHRDLVEIERTRAASGQAVAGAAPVRAVLRRGARLTRVGDGRTLRQQLRQRWCAPPCAPRLDDPDYRRGRLVGARERAYQAALAVFGGGPA